MSVDRVIEVMEARVFHEGIRQFFFEVILNTTPFFKKSILVNINCRTNFIY